MSTNQNLEEHDLIKIWSPADTKVGDHSQPIGLRRERQDAAWEDIPKNISVRRPQLSFLEDLLGDG